MTVTAGTALENRLARLLAARTRASETFFGAEAERIARLCHRCAERFERGGRLVAVADTAVGRSDARHVAVEFVHPVIVGKRALPALALGPEGGDVARQVAAVCRPEDIVMVFGDGAAVASAVGVAAERGCETVAFAAAGAAWEFLPPTDDPFVAQELVETLYHVVWELVHVFFDHGGLLEGRSGGGREDSGGAAAFLYPFLDDAEEDLEAVVADVARSIVMKAAETSELRARLLEDERAALMAAAAAVRRALDDGATVLVCGNGGSATDAMDLVADLRQPPNDWPARPALDLAEDSGILTALANDIGPEVLFSRQVIAYGRRGDVLVAISTSGGSQNVLSALREARQRGLLTVALVGYDGGAVAAEGLADHVVVSRSQHIPRVQEAQATAYHVLRELIEARP